MMMRDVKRIRLARVCLLVGLSLAALRPGAAGAQQSASQEEALKLAFPTATKIERKTAFLSAEQKKAAEALAGEGVEPPREMVTYYVARRGTTPLGVAYFDSHIVRTMPEVVMVVVSPRAVIERIEVLRFAEPREFRATAEWIDQLERRPLDGELSLNGRIRGLSGATLTSRALTGAARRVLALHQVIAPLGAAAPARGR